MSLNWSPREHYKDARVAETYDSIRFNSVAGRIFNYLERRALLRALRGLPRGAEIIDVPCGTGRLAEAMLGAGYRVTGIDISPAMLDQAVRRLASFQDRFVCRVGDATTLGEPARPYDAAVCARILMHFPLAGQIEFLRGVARQTDGPIVFNQSFDSAFQRIRRHLKRLLRQAGPAAFPLSQSAIERLLEGAGLRELQRIWVAPGISEAFFLVAEKRPAATDAARSPHDA